jgi:hypothetical protein
VKFRRLLSAPEATIETVTAALQPDGQPVIG